jgi:hypothetical protein
MNDVLLTTGQVVQAIGGAVSARTLARLASEGAVPVAATTPGGHARFRLDDVRDALVEQGVIEEEDAPRPDPDCPECGGSDSECGECCPDDDGEEEE